VIDSELDQIAIEIFDIREWEAGAGFNVLLVGVCTQEIAEGSDSAILHYEDVDSVNAHVVREVDVDLGCNTLTVGQERSS
jgi:hypothetical protein